ncbi:MAG: DUF721 domain-containing protein [Bacteroidaceae bacterium]|nr:DUF721 domain-containing protein [Bacteroidaceae bacterium]
MKRRNTESLAAILSQYLRQEGLETPLAEHRAIEAWPQVAGEAAAAVTESVALRGQTLWVKLTSPIVRQELLMRRDALAAALNKAAGMHLIYEIRLA